MIITADSVFLFGNGPKRKVIEFAELRCNTDIAGAPERASRVKLHDDPH
jgi:hypothetical protein